MNLLEMTQKVCGIVGYVKPQSLSNLGVEQERTMNDIVDSWLEIQMMERDWDFLVNNGDFNILSGQRSYTAIELNAPTMRNIMDGAYLVRTADNQIASRLTQKGRDLGELAYSTVPVTVPRQFAFYDKTLIFNSVPDQSYKMVCRYRTSPVTLSLETDIPACNEEHHPCIVQYALMKYSVHDNDPEQYQDAENRFTLLYNRMHADHAPHPTIGECLR